METPDSFGTPFEHEDFDELLVATTSTQPISEVQDDPDVRSSQLLPSSQGSSTDVIDFRSAATHREMVRESCQLSQEYVLEIIAKYDQAAVQHGWCRVVTLAASKENGYVQVSWAGANKFAVLQEIVVWANGVYVPAGEDASHLCHHKKCLTLSHIIPESTQNNQARKGCRVWVDCNHCEKKIFVCIHQPSCIKYCAGFDDHNHFVSQGICRNINQDPAIGV